MSITFTTSYKEVLASETLEKITEWCEEGDFAIEDALKFIDEHSEEEFCDYYDEYVGLGEEYGYDPVDSFVKLNDIRDIRCFESAYLGKYDSPTDFAEEYCSDEVERLYYVIPDWEATADYLLAHDIDREGDFYFRCSY
jgi:spore coat protein CotH